jgi:hypothetical protein
MIWDIKIFISLDILLDKLFISFLNIFLINFELEDDVI